MSTSAAGAVVVVGTGTVDAGAAGAVAAGAAGFVGAGVEAPGNVNPAGNVIPPAAGAVGRWATWAVGVVAPGRLTPGSFMPAGSEGAGAVFDAGVTVAFGGWIAAIADAAGEVGRPGVVAGGSVGRAGVAGPTAFS